MSIHDGWKTSQASILGIFAANATYCALSVLGLIATLMEYPGSVATATRRNR